MRVRILVDFWNLQIAWNSFRQGKGQGRPPIPKKAKLPDVLTRHRGGEAVYTGCHVYASVDPRNPADASLRRFLHAMNGFPGYRVTIKEGRTEEGTVYFSRDQDPAVVHQIFLDISYPEAS